MDKVIPLGAVVKDRISGFEGVVTARIEYLFTQPRVQVESEKLRAQTGAANDAKWFYEAQVCVVKAEEADESRENQPLA